MNSDNLLAKEISFAIDTDNTNRPFLFKLEPYFASDEFDMLDKTYFPKKTSNKRVLKYPIVKYYQMKNPYMDNEIKGFIRHQILDKKCSSGTIRDYMMKFVKPWTEFINEKYPMINSCLEIDYDILYSKYISWLGVHNLQYECVVEQTYMKKNMEWVQAKRKTLAVIGFERYYKYIASIVYPDDKSEYQKDIWDVRKLGIPVNITPGSPKYTINFQKISQEWLKEKVRKYIYHRVQYKAMNTVLKDINAMNIFSEFLKVYYPNINELTLFNRRLAE